MLFLCLGGGDTTGRYLLLYGLAHLLIDFPVSALTTFVLAMVMFPEGQKKAQAELDKVVGRDRLPKIADRASLPYVEALFKEVLRCVIVCISGQTPVLTRRDTAS